MSVQLIAGVDEAGRGALAGPVVAAVVILTPGECIAQLDDSKKLSAARRAYLEIQIKRRALDWAAASASVAEIDRLNILQASLLAMQRAVEKLAVSPNLVRVDGNVLPALACAAEAIIRGDALHAEISAASIVAKQTRDRIMLKLAAIYPQYGFQQHKGYATKAHIRAVELHGVSRHHRRSFSPVKQFIAA